VVGRWLALTDSRAWSDLVSDLLLTHYDPSYLRATRHNYLHYDVAQRLALERLDEAAVERAASELSKAV
jgi:tRNA 2-selenouridine synthase